MDIFNCSVGFTASIYFGYVFAHKAKADYQNKRLLQKRANFYPSLILSDLHINKDLRGKWAKSAYSNDEYVIRGAVEGRIACEKPLISAIDKQSKYVYVNYERHSLYNTSHESKLSRHKWVYGEDFDIVDPSNENAKCKIKPTYKVINSHTSNANELTNHERLTNESTSSFWGKLLSVFGLISLGYTDKEYALKLGGYGIVYGDIVYNVKTNTIRMDKPVYVSKSMDWIINEINYSMVLNICAAFAFVSLGTYFAKKAWAIIKKIMQKHITKIAKSNRSYYKPHIEIDNYDCIQCKSEKRNIISYPCYHISLCKLCYEDIIRLNNGDIKCMVCDELVIDTAMVYIN